MGLKSGSLSDYQTTVAGEGLDLLFLDSHKHLATSDRCSGSERDTV